ncbi:MAG: NAD-glutamate dehydrogenase [Candidatus Mesenet longicola]|uniref:NAD-glutamate dehydrogenase n=1 Tax=Candidatus Mesenet longicola TaxID=1892558 RepID=A0A8J3HU11_9RICK|nr:MAG: NAD-glutamate dehydrogenase [Candidatus Mesenet longicola]GHM59040.1 MAG: NAD-glutamate dehydrogenase [Candidatus Mesenet longicola]
MYYNYSISNQVIDSVLKLLSSENGDDQLQEFIKHFYNLFYNSDLKINDEFLLYLAQDVYQFILSRNIHRNKVHIFNPDNIPQIEGKFTIIKLVNDNMPFLVDSVTNTVRANGLSICYYINSILNISRKNGTIQKIYPLKDEGDDRVKEAVMYIMLKRIDDSLIANLENDIKKTLAAVECCVNDWPAILNELDAAIQNMHLVNTTEAEEICVFLNWLKDNNFVFLGYKKYFYSQNQLVHDDKKDLGLHKIDHGNGHVKSYYQELGYLYIAHPNLISIVHRRAYLDCIGVRNFDQDGNITGEQCFFGFFASVVSFQDIRLIPIIRKKVKAIEERVGFLVDSHNNKALISILQKFPRDELFHSSEDELLDISMAVLTLTIKPGVKLFLAKRIIGSFINTIVFIPIANASVNLILKIQEILENELNGTVVSAYNSIIDEYNLVMLKTVLKIDATHSEILHEHISTIENKLIHAAQKWQDRFLAGLYSTFGIISSVFLQYQEAFPISYQESFEPNEAYFDIKKLEIVREKKSSEVNFKSYDDHCEIKLYTPKDKGLQLSEILHVIKNIGTQLLSHNSYYINIENGIWIHHFVLSKTEKAVSDISLKEQLEATLTKVFMKEVKNDYFNSLVILASLTWKEVLLIRALSSYLKQICFNYSQAYVQKVMAKHPKITKCLIQLFHARFDPSIDIDREEATAVIKKNICDLLESISDVTCDYVLRSMLLLILAILRTNYYQDKLYISVKFDSSVVPELPLPYPFRELYVYSYNFEGIHLRGGRLARGGIRWSDRVEDFRTEVLGLMKAQMTKNAAIVPVGAKGGFILKHSPKEKNLVQNYAIECYKNFIRGMLDVTDNIVQEKVIIPNKVVRYDEDDPYLVVAADKGTASFSDYANQVSSEYSFWLGDAFASGGSAGYDHKKMAITARGAWVAAQRHFWRMNKDIEKEVFTVVGIGDMSGDLFGNGMLLSKNISLVGAFNHSHIFIDPNPDPKTSFAERKRLFDLPRSTWADYDKNVISVGGGIFERSAKSIQISEETKERFNIKEDKLSPNQLIKYLLKANVDMIWNGGIGTYFKASSENNSMVRDKANDLLRVDGKDIRASMVIEGGNLGSTQLARVEYAKNGGYINTDFVDNAGGVTCSDLEVNIKIVLASAIKDGSISLKERNQLLSSMTNDVAFQVLENHSKINTKALMLESLQAKEKIEHHHRLLLNLERLQYLNRNIEFLPNDEEITRMLNESSGFSTPQLAILISYCKTVIKNEIIHSDIPDNEFLSQSYLLSYFPEIMVSKFKNYILKHQLYKEIISTYITNEIISRMGCTYINHLIENSNVTICEAVSIYITIIYLHDLKELWKSIDALDSVIDVNSYLILVKEIRHFVEQMSFWFAKNINKLTLTAPVTLAELKYKVQILDDNIVDLLSQNFLVSYNEKFSNLLQLGIEQNLASRIVGLKFLTSGLDIIFISDQTNIPLLEVGKLYFELKSCLHFDRIKDMAKQLKVNPSYWQHISINSLLDDLNTYYHKLTLEIINNATNVIDNHKRLVEEWFNENKAAVDCYTAFLNNISAYKLDLGKLVLIIKRFEALFFCGEV